MRVLIPDSVIIELIEHSLFDHCFHFLVVLLCDLLVDFKACFELKVKLQQTINWSLCTFYLSLKNPIFFVHDLIFILLNLFMESTLLFSCLRLFLVLKLNFPEVIKLIIEKVFSLVFFFLLLMIFI